MRSVRFVVAALAVCPGIAFAQQAAPAPAGQDGVLVYGPDFFAHTAVDTALEMVQRLPGFTPDYGNTDARGLAGNTGNILIDGKPAASKTDGLSEILRRITAASVARIELIRGSAPGIDMQGRGVVANVVLKHSEATEKLIDLRSYVYRNGFIGPDLTLQYTHRDGTAREELSVEGALDRTSTGTAWGSRTRTDASGKLIHLSDLDLSDRYRNANIRGMIQREAGGGVLRLNTRIDYTHLNSSQTVTLLEGSGSNGFSEDGTHSWTGELGANWTRGLGEKAELELVALQRLGRTDYDSTTLTGGITSTFGSYSRSGESVFRPILRYKLDKNWSFEGGGEIAYNFLDNSTVYTEQAMLVALPDEKVFVSELRGELFGQATWHPGADWTVEAGLRAELSRITSDGDTRLSRSFFYPKPRLQVTWQAGKHDQVRLRAERSVSQLDFNDFIASTEVNLGTVLAGNGRLVPEQTWTLEGVYEHRFWGEGALELGFTHEATTNVIDYIPLTSGYDAIGNIGDGTRDTLSGKVTLPFDKLGIKHARIRASAAAVRSRVTDPLTGERRRYAQEVPFTCNVTFTHDLAGGKFTYGIDHACNVDRYKLYRIDELRTVASQPQLTLFAIWKPAKKLTLRMDLGNATNASTVNVRDIYTADRNNSPLLYREVRTLRHGQYIFLQVRRAF